MLTFGYRSRYNVRLHRNSRRCSIAVGKTAVVPARCEIFERQLSVCSALYHCFVAVFINGDPLISNFCVDLAWIPRHCTYLKWRYVARIIAVGVIYSIYRLDYLHRTQPYRKSVCRWCRCLIKTVYIYPLFCSSVLYPEAGIDIIGYHLITDRSYDFGKPTWRNGYITAVYSKAIYIVGGHCNISAVYGHIAACSKPIKCDITAPHYECILILKRCHRTTSRNRQLCLAVYDDRTWERCTNCVLEREVTFGYD